MAFVDYYKILGVDKNIPQKDVRAAYRKRAKQFHPDLHPNDPKAKAKFQALNEAYDVISDPDKRAKYDQYGEQWKNAQAYEQAGGGFGGLGAILSRDSTSVVSVREAVVSAASSRISLEVEDAALAAMLVVVSLDSLASEAVLVALASVLVLNMARVAAVVVAVKALVRAMAR